MDWEEIVNELERATAQLHSVASDDFLEMADAMNRRSVAVQRLQELAHRPSSAIPPVLLERIQRDFRRGANLHEKLLLAQAAVRSEVSRVAETGHLMRALAKNGNHPARRVNCTA